MYFIHLVLALVSPSGRLSQVPFAFLCILLACGHLWAYGQIVINETGLTWNTYTITLFAMLWMQFCVFTRRARDCGSSGVLYLPVLAIAILIYLVVLDPEGMWPGAQNSFLGEMTMDWGMRFLRALYLALFIWGIKAAGDTGPNGYGPEFGESRDSERAGRKVDHRLAKQQPTYRYGQVSKSSPAWGQRRRAGFGRR
ncbi:MAG: DUF805 domain-containing protein [Pseudomonadota bacterium]